MPITGYELTHFKMTVPPDLTLTCRRSDTTWLYAAETRELPAREFAVQLLEKHLSAPIPDELKQLGALSDDRLVEIGDQWLRWQPLNKSSREEPPEIHTLEELKQEVYADDARAWQQMRESFRNIAPLTIASWTQSLAGLANIGSGSWTQMVGAGLKADLANIGIASLKSSLAEIVPLSLRDVHLGMADVIRQQTIANGLQVTHSFKADLSKLITTEPAQFNLGGILQQEPGEIEASIQLPVSQDGPSEAGLQEVLAALSHQTAHLEEYLARNPKAWDRNAVLTLIGILITLTELGWSIYSSLALDTHTSFPSSTPAPSISAPQTPVPSATPGVK